ncbi:hypothetical protein SAMN04488074_11938 [Lentzea albidocapillata subsp. violacea]|uniref:Uncharacterized protein n=1 Tax=Lentzea albidocapillata subsp. violacea TaxID=128104 RepID=A0A1G9RVU5_9PSEU|nr:hypothetical protein SAMN04488074_11938 [Lentzea albidocapillata subsp. violacea]
MQARKSSGNALGMIVWTSASADPASNCLDHKHLIVVTGPTKATDAVAAPMSERFSLQDKAFSLRQRFQDDRLVVAQVPERHHRRPSSVVIPS